MLIFFLTTSILFFLSIIFILLAIFIPRNQLGEDGFIALLVCGIILFLIAICLGFSRIMLYNKKNRYSRTSKQNFRDIPIVEATPYDEGPGAFIEFGGDQYSHE